MYPNTECVSDCYLPGDCDGSCTHPRPVAAPQQPSASSISIVRQEFPASGKPYRLIETYMTVEGMRTRVCSGMYATYDQANFERAELLFRATRPLVAPQQDGGEARSASYTYDKDGAVVGGITRGYYD